MSSREVELEAYGCSSPGLLLRDGIPRYANHFGLTYEEGYQAVLGEFAVLCEARNENFRMMEESGFEHRMLQIYAKRAKLADVGERPLIVIDNFVSMMKAHPPANQDNPFDHETTYYDPGKPLAIRNFYVLDDPIPRQCVTPITIGRPNADGELWLAKDITVEDYDVVKACFKRLLALRLNGAAPHMSRYMDTISIPYLPGRSEDYRPVASDHDEVDYTGFAEELKIAS